MALVKFKKGVNIEEGVDMLACALDIAQAALEHPGVLDKTIVFEMINEALGLLREETP